MQVSTAGSALECIEAHFSGHAYDPHRHDVYAIGYTLSGLQTFRYRGWRRMSRDKLTIVIHPDEVHDGAAGGEEGFTYRMIYLSPHRIAAALGGRARALPFVSEVVARNDPLMRLLADLFAAIDSGLEPLDEDRFIVEIADALLRADPSAASSHSDDATCQAAVGRAREYLDARFRETVRSEELEAVTGLDRYRTARHFRRSLGTSPYRYLTMRRLDEVRRMVRDGAALGDAAVAAGFADQSHMTRQFKRAYGLSPGRFRQISRP